MRTKDECPQCNYKYMRRYGSILRCPRCGFQMRRSWHKGRFRYRIDDLGKQKD